MHVSLHHDAPPLLLHLPGDWCAALETAGALPGGDAVRFPYSVLEIKLASDIKPAWINVSGGSRGPPGLDREGSTHKLGQGWMHKGDVWFESSCGPKCSDPQPRCTLQELLASGLLVEVPRFSKFLHGGP
jgi:hypothetical protein